MGAKIKAVVPVWSQYIEVSQQEDGILLIKGDGYSSRPLIPARPQELRELDLTHRLRRYSLHCLNKSHRDVEIDGPDGVYQFANATTDDKLIAFVQEFGPINGEVIEERPAMDEWPEEVVWEVTVKETFRRLRREQKQFRRLVEVVKQVKPKAHADFAVLSDLLISLAAGTRTNDSDDWISAMGSLARLLSSEPSAKLLPVAHQILCCFFNRHPPQLFPFADGVVELPRVNSNGIRDVLYFQLRLDYLAQRTIATCLNCHGHFPVFRRGTPTCGESCSRTLRNQQYWKDNKETINASRRGSKPRKSKATGATTSRKTSTVNTSTRKGK